MVTISRVVEKIIEENPFIQEALSKGIINYASLAESMKERVEAELKQKVKESAIMMAIRRLAEKLDGKILKKPKFDDNADVFVKSDLFEITVKKSKRTYGLIKTIYENIDSEKDFMTITHGLMQITIIANKRNKNKLINILNGEKVIKLIDNLSLIGTTIPNKAIEEAGYFYLITRAFAWENIPIIELVSTLTELNIIIKEKDIPKAFIVFKEVIERNN